MPNKIMVLSNLSNGFVRVLQYNMGLTGCFVKISSKLRYLEVWEN